MLDEIRKDLAERLKPQVSSFCASADEVRLCWLVCQLEDWQEKFDLRLDALTRELRKERDQWKANHADMVARNDLPVDRIPAHDKLVELQEKVAYVESMGLHFGIMKTSDRPEGFLAHTWDKNSDHTRMFKEWSKSIGWERKVERAVTRCAEIAEDIIHETSWGEDGDCGTFETVPEAIIKEFNL